MKLNINMQILSMVILVCFSCQSTSNKTDSKSQESRTIAAKSKTKVVRNLKYNDHCLVYNPGDVNSLKFEKSNMYFPTPTTIDIITFNKYAESAYLLNVIISMVFGAG